MTEQIFQPQEHKEALQQKRKLTRKGKDPNAPLCVQNWNYQTDIINFCFILAVHLVRAK